MLARPARILLADDHALVRSGLRMIPRQPPIAKTTATIAIGSTLP